MAKRKRYFRIEPDIPIPEKRSGGNSQHRHYQYSKLLAEMEPGDSFLCPDNTNPVSVDLCIKRFTVRVHREWKFVRRILEDGTVRVWRVA